MTDSQTRNTHQFGFQSATLSNQQRKLLQDQTNFKSEEKSSMSQKRPGDKTDSAGAKYRKDLTAVTMNDMHDYRSSNQNRMREN